MATRQDTADITGLLLQAELYRPPGMTSLAHRAVVIRTAAVERVVAPIAAQLCRLVLLCERAGPHEQLALLEEAARAVATATRNMAAEAARRAAETDDDVMRSEMSSLVEPITVSGQHALLAAQRLSIQPRLAEHREELINATQNVLMGVVKVLLVEDDAAVRKAVAAADWVLESLSELGACLDLPSLLRAFQTFSESLVLLHGLVRERAEALQDGGQTELLLEGLETLRKCISMLHTAMVTTITHPSSQQAQEAKRYILDKVASTVGDIITTLRSDRPGGAPGPCGFYAEKRDSLLQLLAGPLSSSSSSSSSPSSWARDGGVDVLLRDLVFHCMEVANCSRRDVQQSAVDHCRHVLQLWADRDALVKLTKQQQRDPDDDDSDDDDGGDDDVGDPHKQVEDISVSLTQQILLLDRAMETALLYQVLDTFVAATPPYEDLMDRAVRALEGGSPGEPVPGLGNRFQLQPPLEDFLSVADRTIQVARFVSASAGDAKSVENVENSRACLSRLRAGLASLSPDLDGQSEQSAEVVRNLVGLCRRWGEESSQVQDALYDVIDAGRFTSLAGDEMAVDRRGCEAAYKEQSHALFCDHARQLTGHLSQVVQCVRRHVDRSDSPIYRNGLLVLLRQTEASQARVAGAISDMVSSSSGAGLNVEAFSAFSESVSTAMQQAKVLREGLDGQRHPHLLSPLRAEARRTRVSPAAAASDGPAPGLDRRVESTQHPALEVERDPPAEHKDKDFEDILETPPPRRGEEDRLKETAALKEPKPIPYKPPDVDLLPLLYEVVTVTKGKDVTVLNKACTEVLELSNCYAQAAKEASALVDAVDRQSLDVFRAELVSVTPLLVQTAQETAMSSGRSADSIYRHSTVFTDLVNNIRKLLLPVAGAWHRAVSSALRNNMAAAAVVQQLSEAMSLCADAAQLLTSSDIPVRGDCQESFTVLHSKLNKAHNHHRHLAEQAGSHGNRTDLLEGLGLLWALSVQVLLRSLDKILESAGGGVDLPRQTTPQKRLAVMSENSLRIQEAARLTALNCKSGYKVKLLTGLQDELKTLTETYLGVAEDLGSMCGVLQLARSELLQRQLLIKIRVLSGHLNKHNQEYMTEIQRVVSLAYSTADWRDDEQRAEEAARRFEEAAELLFENVKAATSRVQDCFSYVRDPRERSSLRSVSDHLSFQISDIVSRARLAVETRCVCDSLGLEVQVQCWAAKACYVAEQIWKVDGIQQGAKELVRAGLQGRVTSDAQQGGRAEPAPVVREEEHVFSDTAPLTRTKHSPVDTPPTEKSVSVFTAPKPEPAVVDRHQSGDCFPPPAGPAPRPGGLQDGPSLTYTSLFLRQETDRWDSNGNRIVQVTREMADKIYHMAQYLRKKGPIPTKEAFVDTAKGVVSNCQSITQFVSVITDHCLDQQSSVELKLIMEQILTITNQLTIISSVNALTPGSKSSDEILVKNAQNLLQIVLQGVRAAETACIKGLRQPQPGSEAAEAAALCFQWRRKLQLHRAQQQSSPDTDNLGLRRTADHPGPPSLAPSLAQHKHTQGGYT